jgi:hypothetical protein
MEGLYENIELEIVSHLNGLVNNDPDNGDVLMFDVVALPQLQADYQRPFQHVRVTVAYKSSDFGEIKSTHHITQPEKIQIEVIIQSRFLRGVTGIHKFTDIVKRRLVGFRPTDCTKMYLVKNGFSDYNNESALWSYSLLFETTYTIVEDGEFELGPLFTQALFEYNKENPAIPAVPFPGTQPNPPILAYKGDIAYWDGEVWRRLHPSESGHVLATRGEGEVPEWVEPQAGAQGDQGEQGVQGEPGQDGADGQDGLSAYEIALANGFEGTESEWLLSLKGEQGAPGPGIATGGTEGQVLVKKSATDFDTEWKSLRSLLGIYDASKNGDQTTVSTTAVAVTGLEFLSLSAGKYSINGSVAVSSSTTAGIKLGIVIPSGGTMRVKALDRGSTINNSVTEIFTSPNDLSSVSFCQVNGNSIVNMAGTITIPDEGGDVTFIFAKTTSGTAGVFDEGTQLQMKKI